MPNLAFKKRKRLDSSSSDSGSQSVSESESCYSQSEQSDHESVKLVRKEKSESKDGKSKSLPIKASSKLRALLMGVKNWKVGKMSFEEKEPKLVEMCDEFTLLRDPDEVASLSPAILAIMYKQKKLLKHLLSKYPDPNDLALQIGYSFDSAKLDEIFEQDLEMKLKSTTRQVYQKLSEEQ